LRLFLGCAAGICLLVVLLKAQEGAPAQADAVFRTETALMEVEVRIRDTKGQRVPGLTREDFQLFENGEPQEIATLEYVADPTREAVIRTPAPGIAAGEVRGKTEPPTPGLERATRIFIATHVAPGELKRVRKAVREFIANDLPAGALVSIDGTPFIGDQRLLLNLVDGKVSSDEVPGKPFRSDVQAGTDFSEQAQRDVIRQGFGATEQGFSNLILEQQGRSHLYRYTDMIRGLAHYPGKKVIVLFARGLQMGFSTQQDLAGPLGVQGQKGIFVNLENAGLVRRLHGEAMRARIQFYVVASQALEALDAQGDITFTTQNIEYLFGANPDGKDLAAFRRAVHTRAPTAGLGEGSYMEQQGLRMLAEQTGGRAVLNSNDMGRVFELVNEDLGGYYLLGYYPPERKPDTFRRVQIETTRPGLKLEYTRGFYDRGELERFSENHEGELSLRAESDAGSPTTKGAPKKALKAYEQAYAALQASPVDYETAFAELDRATEAYPDFATAWNLTGYLRFARGEHDAARAAFENAIAADGAYVSPLEHLLRLNAGQQRWSEAESTARKLLALDTGNTEAAYHLAVAQFNQGNLDAAMVSIEQTVASGNAGTYPQTYRLQGDVLAAQADLVGAANAYREFLAAQPESAMADAIQGQIAEWETQLELQALGEYLQAGKWDDVDRQAAALLEAKPDQTAARLFRALAKFNLGDLSAADQLAQQVRDAPDAEQFPQAHYLLGLVHSEQGDIEVAIREWKEFLQRRGDSPLAAEVRETITDWETLLEP